MPGLADDPSNRPADLTEDPEVTAYSILADAGDDPSVEKATAYALLALVREIKGLRRDVHKASGKPPTMKRKFQ